MTEEFSGLHEDMYRFFWEIAFHNDESFYRDNLERYKREVKIPLYALAAKLIPAAQRMDEDFSPRLSTIVSKIRRDTRFVHDGAPFRDHAWIAFRYPGNSVSMAFTPYIEFNRDSWGYGMGMYAPDAELIGPMRSRILSAPDEFLDLIHDPSFSGIFSTEGAAYKRKRFSHSNEEIERYLNLRQLSFQHVSSDLRPTLGPEIVEICIRALDTMCPVYRFLVK